jgi:protein arginine kinase activator
MSCEKCHKENATVHLTAIENGVKREAHLCDECARQAGVSGMGFKFNFSIGDIFLEMPKPAGKASQARCPECGISYTEFKQKARLGCANDYDVFRSELLRLLEKIHGSTTHAGKTPNTVDAQVRRENELLRLKRDLDSVVRTEDFEKAAQLRDRIRALETDLDR